jgi:hypothetical protein
MYHKSPSSDISVIANTTVNAGSLGFITFRRFVTLIDPLASAQGERARQWFTGGHRSVRSRRPGREAAPPCSGDGADLIVERAQFTTVPYMLLRG